MVGLDGSPGHLFGKDVDAEQGEAHSIDDAALALPVVSEDVILARRELEIRANKGPKIRQRQRLNDQRGSPRECQ